MTTTGLRELRQQASDLVRQAEAGETIIVTVNGRQVAQLGPVRRNQWRHATEIGAIFAGPADADWAADRDLIDNTITDPFTR
ncbi:MAG TPA: type II toxin-antitoxin system prevent-host-death family antitoxin [Jatrophihabitans sp.]|nr:type II toxin-antitoxin system prevent-host-death family antitoxin [Jatrophihabitans sp.]